MTPHTAVHENKKIGANVIDFKRVIRIIFLIPICLANEIQAQWLPTNGPTSDAISSLMTIESRLFAGTANGHIFISTDDGDNWLEADSGLSGKPVWTIIADGTNLFAGTDKGAFVSSNNGADWSHADSGIRGSKVYALLLYAANLFAGTDSGIYRSSDNGSWWQESDSGLASLGICALAAIGDNLVAGTLSDGFFLSGDGGIHWVPISSVVGTVWVTTFATSGDNIYAGVSWLPPFVAAYAGVFISTDHGASWNKAYAYGSIEGGGMYVFDLEVSGTTLFEAASFRNFVNPTYDGVYLSNDSGKTWLPASAGLVDSNVYSLAVHNGSLFAGTSTMGVWKRPLSEITSVCKPRPAVPKEFGLSQNHPNPFNPKTVISYQLPVISKVSLKVYDILGRTVATLVDREKAAGSYSVAFDASKLSSGVYFYRLEAGTYGETRKLILLK
jgi:ligand-binding sensor domain-containing protein